MWKTLNKITDGGRRKNQDPTSITVDNKKYEKIQDIVEIFNYKYVNIAHSTERDTKRTREEKDKQAKEKYTTPKTKTDKFRIVTENEIKKIICELKPFAAAGADQIPAKIIKDNVEKLAKPITHLVNLSLQTGVFPEIYKEAIIRPIYKGGDVNDVNNYRSISLISNISKIIEKTVKNQISKYLENSNYFSASQLGFRKNKGTEDAINRLHIEITNCLDKNKKCLTVFQDLSKAFNLVLHQKLIAKIEEAGCGGEILQWFKSYLHNRTQKVRIGTTESSKLQLKIGTPQGTALSPLLFLIYVNEIGQLRLKGTLISYADDTAIIENGETWKEVKKDTEADMTKIVEWLEDNNLKLNMKKTNLVQFTLKNKKNEEELNFYARNGDYGENDNGGEDGWRIQRVKHTKYLGVTIDENLNWKEHFKILTAKLLKPIYLATQVKNMISDKVKRIIYMALIQSKIQYGIAAWGAAYKTNLKSIERNQKKFLKILYKKPRTFGTKQLFQEIKVPTISELHQIATIKYVKKINVLKTTQKIDRITRTNQTTVPLPKVNTNAGKTNSIYKGLQNFNRLDTQDRELIINAKQRNYKKTIRTIIETYRQNERTTKKKVKKK